ncbi:MAG TPA: hypothetical protein VFZ34_33955 [Blastocatellia bacterium]|nr:hypothetical protein [Blastocatellia bacterium]
MELMLPFKHVTDQDKRALTLYLVIALLCAVGVVFVMLYKADFQIGKKTAAEQSPTPTPKPTSRNRS